MRAIRLTGAQGLDSFQLTDTHAPPLGPDEVRVQVKAAGLNRADLQQAMGRYPAPPGFAPDLPGMEFAGTVVERGPRAQRFSEGDRVMGLVPAGAFCEQVVTHERTLLSVPGSLDLVDAAAVPEAFLTAFDALVSQGGLVSGEWLLVHAAASGVGTAAVQLAHALGARVVGTVRSEAKREAVMALGADEVVVVGKPPLFGEAVRKRSGGGVHVALDLVGGNYVAQTLESLRLQGRLLLVGLLGGREAPIDLGRVLSQRLRVQGTVMRARPLEERIAAAQTTGRTLLPLLESGRVKPIVHARVAMRDIRQAVQQMQNDETVGKVVLVWD